MKPDYALQLADIDRQLLALLQQRCLLQRQWVADDPASLNEVRRSDERHATASNQAAHSQVQRDQARSDQTGEETLAWLRHATSIALQAGAGRQATYLGPEYSYSHLAAIKHFGDAHPLSPVATIPAVFESIVRGEATWGVVPIENSTDGRIVDTIGMFTKVQVQICGEILLPIHHNLLSQSPRDAITEVHSKPQALSQCRSWLANHLPKAKLVENSSTTAAAELAAARPGIAAVASIEAGRRYGLNVIAKSIEDNPNNVTRFAVIGTQPVAPTGNDKTSVLFQLHHRPGALADAMLVFKQASLNLTWIESFPLPGTNAEYLFFIEFLGHAQDAAVKQALQQLSEHTVRQELLGAYPRAATLTV